MIAVVVHDDVVLAGVVVPQHRILEVLDDAPDECDGVRRTLTSAQARALVSAGYAEPVSADFASPEDLFEAWRAA